MGNTNSIILYTLKINDFQGKTYFINKTSFAHEFKKIDIEDAFKSNLSTIQNIGDNMLNQNVINKDKFDIRTLSIVVIDMNFSEYSFSPRIKNVLTNF